MKKIFIKFILIPTIILYSINSITYANEQVSQLANNWFTSFSYKISKKYTKQKEIIYFKSLVDKLNKLLSIRKFNDNQKKLIDDLTKLSNEYIFKLVLSQKEEKNKKIIDTNSLIKNFKYKSYNKDNIFKKDWVWYAYIFDTHLYFDTNNSSLNKRSLEANKIYSNSSLVFIKDDWKFWFVNNFKIRKLISDDIIYWISWKYNFLKEIKDDKKILNYDTDDIFLKLKQETKKLTYWKAKSEKIKILYNYILSNISYTENYSLDDPKIFSWIFTYINKNWVCEWYVKLFMYMLNFAYIDNVEVIRWYVLDATDFPNIWHAWVRIWDKYYDPTFDDPVWITKTKKYNEYKYFWLPYDLFYTNRYTFEKIPSFLKTKSIEYRKKFINKRISALLYKYKNSWYNLLKPYLLKEKYNIDLNKSLTIDDLKKIVPYYKVNNWNININWTTKYIKNIKYFVITNSNTEDILNQLNYNLDWFYIFYMKNDNWSYEYRLAYDVIFR